MLGVPLLTTELQLQTLVLLHGAPGDGPLWQPVINALPQHLQVICPTLQWFGPDPWVSEGSEFGTEAHTDQLIRILEANASSPSAVAAWSYSTHVLLNALLLRPDLIGKVFLYEPGLGTYLSEAAEIEAFNADAHRAFGPVVEALQQRGAEAAVEVLFDSSGGPGCFEQLSQERRERYLASARMMPLLMGGGRPPANITADDLAAIKVPVTVAFGRRTRPLFESASRAVARAISTAELRIIDDADHMLPEKDPRTFASVLEAWLRT